MSEISDSLDAFSKRLFKNFGLGNEKVFLAIGVAISFSLMALTGFYIPTLITSINWILALATCGLAFVGISLATEQNPAGIFIGLISGVILGAIVFALSSSMLAVAPIATLLLTVPNIIAAGAYLLAGVCSGIETVCAQFFGTIDTVGINSFYEEYPSSQNTELKSLPDSITTPPSTPIKSGTSKRFFAQIDTGDQLQNNQNGYPGTYYVPRMFSPAVSEKHANNPNNSTFRPNNH